MSKSQHQIGQVFDPLFNNLKPSEIKENLDAMAAKVIDGEYTKNLTKEELNVAKSELADVSIEIAKIEKAKKEAMEDFKQQFKEPKRKHKDLLEAVQFKSVRKTGILYLIDDQDAGMMYSYDENGICVDSRALLPQERQAHIGQGVRKLGTDD